MSATQTVLLGRVAGLTIFLGPPLARLRIVTREHLALLNALAVGVLLFLFVDVMERVSAPVEEALALHESAFWLLLALLSLGVSGGLLGLIAYGQRCLRTGPTSARRLALLIAVGIGLHTFAEGLASGTAGRRAQGGRADLGGVGAHGGSPGRFRHRVPPG